jgi:signal transduction histidine kinase/CheY-like chemotaxis protein
MSEPVATLSPAETPESLPSTPSSWYVTAMEHLVGVVQALSQTHDVATVTRITRDAARELTGADGATFVLRDGDQCYYADENAIEPLWKGKRFPLDACVSGWVMNNARSTTIPDIYDDPRVPTEAYRPTFVKSLAMVPIRRASPIGAIGNYWATPHTPTNEEVAVLQALADTTSVALENARLYEELNARVAELEVQKRRIEEQHASLEVFTHALAHDLKEPVRTVRAFSDMIVNHAGSPEETATYFDFVCKAADRMAMLVDTVFAYTQLHDPSRVIKSTVALDGVLRDACDNISKLMLDHDTLVTADPLPTIQAHGTHIGQVFQNLIANAITHNRDAVGVHVSCEEMPDAWQFRVRDNGMGIAAEDQVRIFQPFKRLKLTEEGAGLGLSICAKIVELHGGRIWCESTPGEGASFIFTIPKSPGDLPARPAAAAADRSVPIRLANGKLANVLLVDDREADIELTRVLLRDRDKVDFNLSVARGGADALKQLAEARANDEAIDLILLDINMPGMDGFETLSRLRADEVLSPTHVVMCTGSTYDKDIQRAETLGAAGYMMKPASLAQLRPMMENLNGLQLSPEGMRQQLLRTA